MFRLFPSHKDAPRVVVTNGMVIWNYSSRAECVSMLWCRRLFLVLLFSCRLLSYDRLYALGVSQFGQMTAGSYCYIGPQGIVHGTTLTLLNASRRSANFAFLISCYWCCVQCRLFA